MKRLNTLWTHRELLGRVFRLNCYIRAIPVCPCYYWFMDKECDACEFLKSPNPKHQILVTDNWSVGIYNDQPYLGRAYATLRTHKGKISELSADEWHEFQDIMGKLEAAYQNAFGAEVLNIECNMNHAFKTEPFNPHVHWHIHPRYKASVEVAGVIFDDPLFGSHIDEDKVNMVSDEVLDEIALILQKELTKK